MRSGNALSLVREYPLVAILAQPQKFAFTAQFLTWQIVQRVDFVGGRGDATEPEFVQFLFQALYIRDEKLDFDFLRGSHGESVNQQKWNFG